MAVIFQISLCVLLTCYYSNAQVQFQCDTSTYCLGDTIEYQCTVDGTSSALAWRISNETNPNIGARTYSSVDTLLNTPEPIATTMFIAELVSTSPDVVSNISFTVQSSIDRHTIECIGNGVMPSCMIDVEGPPSSPSNVTIHTDTFTNTSVNISWTESSSPCVTRYRYNVTHDSLPPNDTIVVEPSALVSDLVRSDEQYCVVVTAIDTANRNSSESNSPCFIFNVPLSVSNITVTNETQSDTRKVIVEWIETQFDVEEETVVPKLLGYKVIVNATDYSITSDLLSPNITEYNVTGVLTGRTYNITVIAVNGVGNSDASTELFYVPGPYVDPNQPPISPSPTVIMTMGTTTTTESQLSSTNTSLGTASSSLSTTFSSSSSSSISPSSGGSESDTSVAAIAGGAGGGIGLILGIIVIVFIVLCCCCKMKKSKSVNLVGDSEKFSGDSGTSKPMQLEDTSDMPQIGQPLYQDVTSGGAKTTELATYQDPSTIRREQAPGSNDLYALPEKKKSEVELPPQGQMYAELDLPSKTTSDNKTTVVVPGTTTEPVIYSDVRGQ